MKAQTHKNINLYYALVLQFVAVHRSDLVTVPQTLTDVKLLQCAYSYIQSDSLYQSVSPIVWIKKCAIVF